MSDTTPTHDPTCPYCDADDQPAVETMDALVDHLTDEHDAFSVATGAAPARDGDGDELRADGGRVITSSETCNPFQTKYSSVAEWPNLQGFTQIERQRRVETDAIYRISVLGCSFASG
ncbi:hypothetical protein Hbl1158_10355 [Halobaculum sp. CBA1158]|uniref:hypothetical protein n=1 Tax=Halobaculum sp. CBA1158 TaxID=2904243 RepID=UPI001F45E25C|nr:hypothetical protein [Halobaculum sp. CBA1158]UIO98936.1 hypothetical protein Hbl1158_10355 [Halobaculum sp. CBA1158]